LTQSVFHIRQTFSGRFHKNPLGPVSKLPICLGEVDHEVFVSMTEAHHGGCGEHIEDQFLGGAGFETGGTSENFGANVGSNGNLRSVSEGGFTIDGDGHAKSAATIGVANGRENVRSGTAGGETDDGIEFVETEAGEFTTRIGVAVFGAFDGLSDGTAATGDETADEFGGNAEGGRTLGGVEHAETAASTGANVDEATAFLDTRDDGVDGARDRRDFLSDGDGHFVVLVAHELDDLARGHVVEIFGGEVALLGATLIFATDTRMRKGHF